MTRKIGLLSSFVLLFIFQSCEEDQPVVQVPEELRIKSMQTIGPSWTQSSVFDYHADGRLTSVQWERNNPYTTTGQELYEYDDQNRLIKMISKIQDVITTETEYVYQNNRIVAALTFIDGIKDNYTFYEYDNNGKLIKAEFFRKDYQANGYFQDEEKLYSYYPDGNLHEIESFVLSVEEGGLVWNNTRTYETYHEKSSLIDTEPSVPGLRLQKNLPLKFNLVTGAGTFTYTFSYRFYPNGLPADRVTTFNDGQTEQTVYTYQ
jgi:antitoxin component YwqK of YwqJK toxin-antitoxin module